MSLNFNVERNTVVMFVERKKKMFEISMENKRKNKLLKSINIRVLYRLILDLLICLEEHFIAVLL